MILLQNTETGRSIELSDSDIDAIYTAMGDYQDYGDDEMEESLAIREKIHSIYWYHLVLFPYNTILMFLAILCRIH